MPIAILSIPSGDTSVFASAIQDKVMKPYFDNGVAQLYEADARQIPLPDNSVHFVVMGI